MCKADFQINLIYVMYVPCHKSCLLLAFEIVEKSDTLWQGAGAHVKDPDTDRRPSCVPLALPQKPSILQLWNLASTKNKKIGIYHEYNSVG
jgi:hypothetical protein